MYGKGIATGLWVTFKHFFNTYVDDLRYAGRKYSRQDNFQVRQGLKAQGAFTVQYPEEKIAVPERFRFVPFLVTEDQDPTRMGEDWCTSCGICAKVCPPQCIWIVRGSDPVTGRPVPQPEAFFIDIDICMNCGFCAEFCPFDAIKMDHDYELASYDRTNHHILNKQSLSKPHSYWKAIAPTTALEEAADRGGWEHPDTLKAYKKAGKQGTPPTKDNMYPSRTLAQLAEAAAVEESAPAPVTAAPTAADNPAPAKAESAASGDKKPKFDKQAMLAKIREKKASK